MYVRAYVGECRGASESTVICADLKCSNNVFFLVYCCLYRVSQEKRAKLREGVPYVKLYRCNPKHLYPKLSGYGDNGQRSLKL